MTSTTADWQRQLAEAFTSVDQLCRHLQLDPSSLPLLADYRNFPLKVPRGFVDAMEIGNPDDPLLQQVLPIQAELQPYPGFIDDPVGDLAASAGAGVIHKYHGRVLLIATGGCAVHCRYCFRRNFPYGEQQLTTQRLEQALTYIVKRPEITEVILSGGDPLLLNDDKLGQLLQRISDIKHIRRIRIHSRIPIVLPARISPRLLQMLGDSKRRLAIVTHANHGNELTEPVGQALTDLRTAGVTLLNQSVLLAGINDNVEALAHLSEKLFDHGVLPYYLHLLDRARGTGHFEVDVARATGLIASLQRTLPGFLVPKLVREQAGAGHKITLS